MAEHTPRPWTLTEKDTYAWDVGQGLLTEEGYFKHEADARLVSAAPDMLELLEWIIDGGWNDGPGSWMMLDRRVEEVIAKAKGEE